jgi:hypothetical protein
MNWSSFIGLACAAPEAQAESLSSQDRAEAGESEKTSMAAPAAAAMIRTCVIVCLPASNGTRTFLTAGVTSMGQN